jgi:hypothetical protein
MTTRLILVAVIISTSIFPLIWHCYHNDVHENILLTSGPKLPQPQEVSLMTSKSDQSSPEVLFPVDINPIDFRFLSHAIIDEKHKLLICAVPKVCSVCFFSLFLNIFKIKVSLNFIAYFLGKGKKECSPSCP